MISSDQIRHEQIYVQYREYTLRRQLSKVIPIEWILMCSGKTDLGPPDVQHHRCVYVTFKFS